MLRYQPTLDDLAEPSIRLFANSKTAKKAKITNTLRGAVFMGAAATVLAGAYHYSPVLLYGLIGAASGAALNYFSYASSLRSRVRKHITSELKSQGPIFTEYTFFEDKMTCETMGVSTTFSLADLVSVSEDTKYLEISFGTKGVCTVPMRVFRDNAQKSEFLALLKQDVS